jgi:hypothetical protein
VSIESTRVVVGTRKLDGQLSVPVPPPVVLRLVKYDPTTDTYWDGNSRVNNVVPQVEGELIAWVDDASRTAGIYVASDRGAGLKWYRTVLSNGAINFLTGKPYDGRAQFYDPLAS